MKIINFLYKNFLKPVAFMFDPETAHNTAIKGFKIASSIPFIKKLLSVNINMPVNIMGINFKNPLGLAAGFDKNGEIYDFLECFGFGFIEIGSVTLNPQNGNPRPRLWRIKEEKALINHFGLNNPGAYEVLKNIEKKGKIKIPLGINIAKNNDCDFNNAHENIAQCFKVLKDAGDFFVINISCPNVCGFSGDFKDYSIKIIESIKEIDEKKVIFIKISPDISEKNLEDISEVCDRFNTGIVAANTTKRRDLIKTRDFDEIEGGLSGKPLAEINTEIIKKIRTVSKNICVISSGGIFNNEDFKLKKNAGADLFEIYTSFIYEGPYQVINVLDFQ